MVYRSADEVRNEYIAVLGPELGKVYYLLYNELAWLHLKWGQFRALFGDTPTRVDLLNAAAPVFFRVVQDSLWEDTLLHLARMTDSPTSCGKANLTFRRLPMLIAGPALQDELTKLVDNAVVKCNFARDWRNKHIAHTDLQLALQESTQPLAVASRKLVSEALEALVM